MDKTERQRKDKRRTGDSGADATLARTLACSLISGGIGALLALILIALCSFAALSGENPDKLISVLGIVIPAALYLISGIIAYRLSRRAPLICGAVSAITLMLLLKFFSFIFKTGADASFSTPIKAVLCAIYALLAILGAIIAANLSFSSKKSSKRRGASRK